METTDYKVQLENFYGPLDLLLFLVREDELNIYDIPIARIAEQYLAYIEIMKKLDINLIGDFLVLAATLMEIKSKMLIPRDEETPAEEDPRFELVKKLIEYKKYKDLSRRLTSLMESQTQKHGRPYFELPDEAKEEPMLELDLWNLVRSFAQLERETVLDVPISIIYDNVPIERFIENILSRLKQSSEINFSDLISDKQDRIAVVKNFLATLELARQKKVELDQEKDFTDIRIRLSSNI